MNRLLFSMFFVMTFNTFVSGQVEKYLNERPVQTCNKGSYVCGMELKNNVDFDFTIEDRERREFNGYLVQKLSSIMRTNYSLILPFEFEDTKDCIGNDFVMLKLVSYKENEVGGGEREGTIEVEILVFKTVNDNDPYKKVNVTATGNSGYGHSSPLESAIEEAAKSLRKSMFK